MSVLERMKSKDKNGGWLGETLERAARQREQEQVETQRKRLENQAMQANDPNFIGDAPKWYADAVNQASVPEISPQNVPWIKGSYGKSAEKEKPAEVGLLGGDSAKFQAPPKRSLWGKFTDTYKKSLEAMEDYYFGDVGKRGVFSGTELERLHDKLTGYKDNKSAYSTEQYADLGRLALSGADRAGIEFQPIPQALERLKNSPEYKDSVLVEDLAEAEKSWANKPLTALTANVIAAVGGMGGDIASALNAVGIGKIPGIRNATNGIVSSANQLKNWAARYNKGTEGELLGNVTQGVVSTTPYLALALASGGASAPALAGSGAAGTAALQAKNLPIYTQMAKTFIKNPAFWYSLSSMFGQKYQQAIDSGASELEAQLNATLYAIPSALIEVSGGFGSPQQTTQKMGETIVDEVKEELLQDFFGGASDKLTTNRNLPLFSTTEDAVINPVNMANTALTTGIVTALAGGGGRLAQKGADVLYSKYGGKPQTDIDPRMEVYNSDRPSNTVVDANNFNTTEPNIASDMHSMETSAEQIGKWIGRATTIKNPYTGNVPDVVGNMPYVVPEVSKDSIDRAKAIVSGAVNAENNTISRKEIKSAYEQAFLDTGGQIQSTVKNLLFEDEPYVVTVYKTAIGKVISDKNLSVQKLAVLDNLQPIIENAEYVGSGEYVPKTSKQKDTVRFDYFETPVKIAGDDYIVTFDVEVFPNSNNYRTHKVINKMDLIPATNADVGPVPTANVAKSVTDPGPVPGAADSESSPSNYYIPQSEENVNTNAENTAQPMQQPQEAVNAGNAEHVEIFDTDTEQMKVSKQVMNILTDRFGVPFETQQLDAAVNGYYDGDVKKIIINENAEEPLLAVVGHEFLHPFKEIDPEGYQLLRNYTESDFNLPRFNEYKKSLLEAWESAGLEHYKNKTDAEINDMVIEEAMSDLMGEVLKSPETIEHIAAEDKTLAQRIVDFLGQIIEQIKELFGGKNQEIRDLVEHYEQVEKLYQEVVAQSRGKLDKNAAGTGKQYSFAGEKAKTANRSLLKQAEQMAEQGASKEEILQKTGWFTGLDGKWRYELDDSKMQIAADRMKEKYDAWLEEDIGRWQKDNPGLSREEATAAIQQAEQMPLTLGEMLDYPELFAAYPELQNVNVWMMDEDSENSAEYNPDSNTILLYRDGIRNAKRSLIHEIQHIIQGIEGFAPGAPQGATGDAYRNNAGEIEARTAADRRNMTAEQRRNSLALQDEKNVVFAENDGATKYEIKEDTDGKPTVVIEEDIFSGHEGEKPHKVIRDYIKNHYTGDFARIIESGQKVYFGKDLPGEYTQSASTKKLYPDFRYAKNQASQNLNELIEMGTDRRWNKNVKEKHSVDAKYGWYKYATRFQVNGKTYDADVLIRNDSDGRKYLYDVVNIQQNRELSKLPSNQNGSGTERSNSPLINSIPPKGETVNTSIRDIDGENTKFSVFRKNSRGEKATEAMQRYEQSGNVADLPELKWAKQYQRDSENKSRYLENQISTAEFEQKSAKTPEEQQRLRKLIDELRVRQKETKLDLETSRALVDAIDSDVVERNYGLADIADDLVDTDKGLKIKNGNYRFNDVYRNMERVFGKHFDVVRPLLDAFDSAKGDYAHDAVNIAQELYSYVVKGLELKPGSRESKAIQWIAEGERNPDLKNADDVKALQEMGVDMKRLDPNIRVPYTKEQLYGEFPKQTADNIVKAEEWFRAQYDRLINDINRTRRRIYPNNPNKMIPKRTDYMRHFQEMREGFAGLADILNADNQITPNLAGISEFTQPKKKWASIDQKRKGKATSEGAIEGFLDYLPQAEYAIHIDPYIDKFRGLARDLAQVKTDAGKSDLNGFITYLNDFANDLAGKTSGLDRVILKSFGSNGRTALRALGWLNNRTKSNAVVGNIGSVAKQVMNIPNGIPYMKNPASILHGIMDVAKGLDKNSEVRENYKKSAFLTERFLDNPFQKFERMSIEKAAGSLLGMADEFGTRAIWNGLYYDAVKSREADPVRYADYYTRKAVAGRGIGEIPLAYKTQVGKLALPFQIEVNNTWNVLRDTIQGKTPKGKLPDYANRFMRTMAWMLVSWGLGAFLEEVTGSKGAFDPAGDIYDGILQGWNEQPEAGKLHRVGRSALRAGQNLAGDFVGNRSFGWLAGEMLSAIDDDWADRFFNGSVYPSQGVNVPALQSVLKSGKKAAGGDWVGSIAEAATSFVTPFGGKQLDKSIRGIGDVVRGGGYQNNIYKELSTGERGDHAYELGDDVRDAIRTGAFGPGAAKGNAEYWDGKRADDIAQQDSKKQKDRAAEDFIKSYRSSHKGSEVVRLYQETKNKDVFPFEPIKREQKFTDKKQPYQFTLTKEQADQYQKLQNEEMQKEYDAVIQTAEYKNADTEGKKMLLKEARSKAKSKVSAQMKKDYLKAVK